jgi:hypothetical protein
MAKAGFILVGFLFGFLSATALAGPQVMRDAIHEAKMSQPVLARALDGMF